jgi:curved DNA binding protein
LCSDLGVHIDGYIAVAAQTFAVPATAGNAATTPISGRAADAYAAALISADTALKSLRPGNKNTAITELISKICGQFNVQPVQGVLSHIMPRNKIDGPKAILNRSDPEQKIEEVTFGQNEVWGIDIVVSTGDGKPKELDNREATVYKRTGNAAYSLKHKISRSIYSEVQTKYGLLPFSLRYLEDATKARFGIAEARDHDLVVPYPVLREREGETVVQVKFTALITDKGTTRITGPVSGLDLNGAIVQSEKKQKDFPEELKAQLKELATAAAASGGSSAAKKKKKKAGGAGGEEKADSSAAAAPAGGK